MQGAFSLQLTCTDRRILVTALRVHSSSYLLIAAFPSLRRRGLYSPSWIFLSLDTKVTPSLSCCFSFACAVTLPPCLLFGFSPAVAQANGLVQTLNPHRCKRRNPNSTPPIRPRSPRPAWTVGTRARRPIPPQVKSVFPSGGFFLTGIPGSVYVSPPPSSPPVVHLSQTLPPCAGLFSPQPWLPLPVGRVRFFSYNVLRFGMHFSS